MNTYNNKAYIMQCQITLEAKENYKQSQCLIYVIIIRRLHTRLAEEKNVVIKLNKKHKYYIVNLKT